jgi:hypothetical protein
MNWNAIAVELERTAETTGINALDYVPDTLPSAAFYVGEMDIEMDVTFRKRGAPNGDGTFKRAGTDQADITCRILVARSDDKYAVRKMRDYMSGSGPTSIAEAIARNKTLGGTVDASHLKTMRGNRIFDVGGKRFYGVELTVFVIGPA